MATKKYTPGQVVTLLRQIEVEIANGKATLEVYPDAQIMIHTVYSQWKEYGWRSRPSSRAIAIHEVGRFETF